MRYMSQWAPRVASSFPVSEDRFRAAKYCRKREAKYTKVKKITTCSDSRTARSRKTR